MKESEWKPLVRSLLIDPEGWAFRGKLCYRRPVSRVLLGVLGEGSGFSKATYVWRVAMPLFIPSTVVVLSWSDREGGGANRIEDADEHELRLTTAAALAAVEDETTALRRIAGGGPSQNILTEEASAYALILLDDTKSARARLAIARRDLGDDRSWVHDAASRMRGVDDFLESQGREVAIAQLDHWEQQTSTALGLVR